MQEKVFYRNHYGPRKPGEPSVTNVKRYIQFHLLGPGMIT
jgi:hypothetical protein